MTEPTSLIASLRELARSGETSDAQLAEARAAILAGQLGAETALPDGAGRPVPLLVWAATWGDREMVALLLDRGADVHAGHGSALHAAAARGNAEIVALLLARGASPLVVRSRESVLRAAHRDGRSAFFPELRRAARAAIEKSTTAMLGLATQPMARRYTLRTDRGLRELLGAVEATRALDVVLVASDLKNTVRALGNLVQAPRREAGVEARPVQDAHRLAFVYRLRGIDWTVVPLAFEVDSPWTIERVPEVAAPSASIAALARALASATTSRVIHVRYDEYTVYSEHGGIETRRPQDLSQELAALGVLVPPMRVETDGYHVQLQLFGVEPSDVERVDVVVLQELGEPSVERTVALPTAVPSLLGPTARVAPPPMVTSPEPSPTQSAPHEPPPLVRPPATAPPPLVQQPPIAATDEPLPVAPRTNEPPPLVREPPAMVNAPITPSAPPPLVREPPPIVPRDDE